MEEAASLILNNWAVYTAVRACRRGPLSNVDCADACKEARRAIQRVRLQHPLTTLFFERPRLTRSQIERAAHLIVRCNTPLTTALNIIAAFSTKEGQWTSTDMISALKRAEAMFRGE